MNDTTRHSYRRGVLVVLALAFSSVILSAREPFPYGIAQSQALPDVKVESDMAIPLVLSEVRVIQDSPESAHLQFMVRNDGSERLLSAEITWRFDYPNGQMLSTHTRLDYVFNDHLLLQPSATARATTGVAKLIKVDSGIAVAPVSVIGAITFAEFANGLRLGTGRERMSKWLRNERKSRITEYQLLLQILRSGGESALQNALQPSGGPNPAAAAARDELRQLERSEGIRAVEQVLRKRTALQIPEG